MSSIPPPADDNYQIALKQVIADGESKYYMVTFVDEHELEIELTKEEYDTALLDPAFKKVLRR